MVVDISERVIQAVLGEVLHSAENPLYVTTMLEGLVSEVQKRLPKLRPIHTKCVEWYEQDAVTAATKAKLGDDLINTLRWFAQNNNNLSTVCQIGSLTELGFISVAESGNLEILAGFKEWIAKTIPDVGDVMLGVFLSRGLDPNNTAAIIRSCVKKS